MNKMTLTGLALTSLISAATACTVKDGSDDDGSTTNITATPGPLTTTGNDTTLPTGEPETLGTTEGDSTSTTNVTPTDTTAETSTDPTTAGPADSELCQHLGGMEGVGLLTGDFLNRVIVDDRINAYFLTNALDVPVLAQCVIDQLGEAVGCDGVTYGCRTMKASHEGLGISAQDFQDFAEDFIAAWENHQLTYPDLTSDELDIVIGVLSSLAPDIVEDADNNVTVYQRVGRKPAIKGLIGYPATVVPESAGSFVDNVANDASINGFFGNTDFDRLNTCLTRQVQGIDGPNTYGLERDGLPDGVDPGASQTSPCRDMVSSHADLVDPNDMLGVEFVDFASLAADLITAMDTAMVPMADQNAILGALGPLCTDIVTVDPQNCM